MNLMETKDYKMDEIIDELRSSIDPADHYLADRIEAAHIHDVIMAMDELMSEL